MTPEQKKLLLALPKRYEGYSAHISLEPRSWDIGITPEMARAAAEHMFAAIKISFPGLNPIMSPAPNTYPFGGDDYTVLEEIDAWICNNAFEFLG